MQVKYIFVFWYLFYNFISYGIEHVTYINTERPKVTYFNPMFTSYVIINSRRIDCMDPRHYVNLYFKNLIPLDNNFRLDFYFYQLLTNIYKPSFIELHYGLCDIFDNDPLIGAVFKKKAIALNITCPFPPMQYNLTNMTISYMPKNFPFEQGRIYGNATYKNKSKTVSVVRGYIDLEIKRISLRKIKP